MDTADFRGRVLISSVIKMLREESDYSDFFIASRDDSERQYEAAEFIISEVKNFLEQRNIL